MFFFWSIKPSCSAVTGGLRGGSFEYAYARINRAVRFDLFSSLVHQDVAFFDLHKTGKAFHFMAENV